MPRSELRKRMNLFQRITKYTRFYRATFPYRRAFGPISGVRLALQVRSAANSDKKLAAINVPGLSMPVYVRPRTVDTRVFQEIFGAQPFALPFSRPATFIVDAGAHIGLSSLFLSKQYPEAKVVSLEIESGNFELLERNTRHNRRITPLRKALWSSETSLQINDNQGETWAYSVSPVAAPHQPVVEAIGVKRLMDDFGVDEIDFLKMDIEGAEKEVLNDRAGEWIHRVRTMAVELHEGIKPGCRAALETAIQGVGFERTQHGDYILLRRDC